MKNLNFFLTMLLFVVFITEIEAQEPTVTTVLTEHEQRDAVSSNNGDFMVVANNNLADDDGTVKLYSASRELLETYILEPGVSGTYAEIFIEKVTITNNGDIYILFIYNVTDDDLIRTKFVKLSYSEGLTEIFKFGGASSNLMKNIGNNIYFTLGVGAFGFDPENSNIPPANIGEKIFASFNILNEELTWTKIEPHQITNIQSKPNGNIAVSKNVDGASQFVEIDSSNGDEVQIIATGTDGNADRCFISDEGKAEMYRAEENIFYLHDGETDQDDFTYRTDFINSVSNVFENTPRGLKKVGDKYYIVSGSYYYCLDGTLTHGNRNQVDLTGYGILKKSWVNPDGSYTFVSYNEDNTTTYILDLVVEDLSFDSILFDVDSDANMITAHDGQVWNGSAWVAAMNQTTVMVGTLPIAGSTVNPNWIPTPNGLSLIGFYPIESLTRNGVTEIVARGRYRETLSPNHKISYKVIFKVNGSLSVTDNTLTDVAVYPNPSRGFISITSPRGVDEVIVTSIVGQVLKQVSFKNNFSDTTEIDISALDSGYYFITVVKEGYAPLTKQIIKQ